MTGSNATWTIQNILFLIVKYKQHKRDKNNNPLRLSNQH